MNREEKVEIVRGLSEKFEGNDCFYIADASGLSVEQTNAFRRICFKAGVEYGVYKNTLIRKALEKAGVDNKELFDSLKGFSGVIFSKESGSAPAKIIQEYRRKVEGKPMLKIASVHDDLYFGDARLDELSRLKSRDEVLGDILSALQAPVRNVVSALCSGGRAISGIVKTLEGRN